MALRITRVKSYRLHKLATGKKILFDIAFKLKVVEFAENLIEPNPNSIRVALGTETKLIAVALE